MEAILATIVSALVTGAIAKAQDVASQAVMDAYNGLKNVISTKLARLIHHGLPSGAALDLGHGSAWRVVAAA